MTNFTCQESRQQLNKILTTENISIHTQSRKRIMNYNHEQKTNKKQKTKSKKNQNDATSKKQKIKSNQNLYAIILRIKKYYDF